MSNFRACKRVGAINSSSRRARVVYSLSFASFPFCFSLSPFLLPLLSLSLTHLAFSHLSPQPHSVPIVTFLSTAISSFSSPLILNPYSRSNCSAPRLFLSLLPSFFSSPFQTSASRRIFEYVSVLTPIYLSYFLSGVQARATLCTVDHPSPPVRRFASKFPYMCTHHAVHLSSALSRFSRAHVSPFSRSF